MHDKALTYAPPFLSRKNTTQAAEISHLLRFIRGRQERCKEAGGWEGGIFEFISKSLSTNDVNIGMTQTKIRGIRVEVREIEHKIREVYDNGADVGIAVEVRNPDSVPGGQMLVAFIETRNDIGMARDGDEKLEYGVQPTMNNSVEIQHPEELKAAAIDPGFAESMKQVDSRLRQILPEYTIPALYIPVQSLPVKNSYKLDRGALKSMANLLGDPDIHDIAQGEKTGGVSLQLVL